MPTNTIQCGQNLLHKYYIILTKSWNVSASIHKHRVVTTDIERNAEQVTMFHTHA